MYIGVHINNAYIAAATIDPNGKTILIKDDSIERNKQFMNSLKIYIENEFAYLGNKVDALLSNNYDLKYIENFLDTLEDIDFPVYEDPSGTSWNAAALMAIFLKKIRTDIQIYDDAPIKGAVVTITKNTSPSLIEAFIQAFTMIKIPLNDVLSMERAAIEGYNISNDTHKTKYILLYYLDHYGLNLSLNTMNEDDFVENIQRITAKKLGTHSLYEQLADLLIKCYEQASAKKMKAHKKNHVYIHQLVDELLIRMEDDTKLYIPLLCHMDDEIIELIITKAELDRIIKAYVNDTIVFLQNEIFKNKINAETIDTILIAGDAKCFSTIEKQLKTLFHREDQDIHNQSPDEVLIRGAAIYAGSTTDALIDTSSHITPPSLDPSETKIPSKKSMDKNTKEDALNIDQLSKLVSIMHINAGCEVL